MIKKILAMLAAVVIVIVGLSHQANAAPKPQPIVFQQTPVIVAHKTGPNEAPYNTTQGIAAAKMKSPSLTWIEIDINFNKSGFPVAYHGSDVSISTDGTGLISDLWLAQTQNLNAADYGPWNDKKTDGSWVYPQYHGKLTDASGNTIDKVHPPYGYEIFDAASKAGVNLLLDMQAVPTQVQADKLYDYITRFNYQDNVIYMGSVAKVQAMKTYHPDINTYVIEYPPTGRIYTAEYLKSIGATGYVIPYTRIDASTVAMMHSEGLKIFTWFTDSVETDNIVNWSAMIALGVDGLITDKFLEASQI